MIITIQQYDGERMRNQVLIKYAKVLFLLLTVLLAACNGRSPTTTPTPIGATAAAPANTPTPIPPTATTPPLPTPTPAAEVGGRSIGDPYAPELGNTGYDVQHYTLRLAIDPAQDVLDAEVDIEAVATAQLTQFSLDFIGFTVHDVTVDGTAVSTQRTEHKLIIDLPQPLPAGAPFTVRVAYSGTPDATPSPYVGFMSSVGMQFAENDTVYVMAEPDGARYWFPSNDHPRDKATFRFELTTLPEFTAVANGVLIDVLAEPLRPLPGGGSAQTHVWEHDYPMAPYLAQVAIGLYERLDDVSSDGVPIRHYVAPGQMEDFRRATAITGDVVDWMSDLFGAYPFEAIGFVTANIPFASLETQTMVLLSRNMIGQQTVVHELAHMWFGNWVSLNSWSEMWRNEGFATYVTLMWFHRDDPEGLALEIEALRAAVTDNGPQYALGAPPPQQLFGFNTYYGGAVMVHDLRQMIGDDAFFAGLRQYFQLYGHSTASDAQFQAVMEEAAGRSLDDFFETQLGGEAGSS